MNRRKFIMLGSVGATAIFSFSYYCCSRKTPPRNDLTEPYYLLQIMDAATISSLGKKYLETTPTEKNSQVLTQLLRDLASPKALASEFIPVAIRNDFTANQLAIVDGWILSQTEARQCALYSLTH